MADDRGGPRSRPSAGSAVWGGKSVRVPTQYRAERMVRRNPGSNAVRQSRGHALPVGGKTNMNLQCPNCQKLLTVQEHYAGQLMKCPLCKENFTVPALPSAGPGMEPAPAFSTPSAPPPPEPNHYGLKSEPPPPPLQDLAPVRRRSARPRRSRPSRPPRHPRRPRRRRRALPWTPLRVRPRRQPRRDIPGRMRFTSATRCCNGRRLRRCS